MKIYETVLFDWDGSLAMTLEIWLQAYKVAMADYGVHATDQEIGALFAHWNKGPEAFGIKESAQCENKAVELVTQSLKQVSLYPGAKELLENAKKTKKVALVSSSRRDLIERGIEHNDLHHCFDLILSREDIKQHKPHPEIVNLALAKLGGNKETTVIVGDSGNDLGAATNAGIDSILIHHPSHDVFYNFAELVSFNPTHVVHSLPEVTALL